MRGCAAALVMFVLAACGSAPSAPLATEPATTEVHVLSAELTVDAGVGVLTFAAHNAGAEPDTLTGASCACAATGEVIGDATIGSQETALFTAGGPHVRFDDLDPVPNRGSFVDVVLTFERAGEVDMTAEVTRG